jgi:hypothetical protein
VVYSGVIFLRVQFSVVRPTSSFAKDVVTAVLEEMFVKEQNGQTAAHYRINNTDLATTTIATTSLFPDSFIHLGE